MNASGGRERPLLHPLPCWSWWWWASFLLYARHATDGERLRLAQGGGGQTVLLGRHVRPELRDGLAKELIGALRSYPPQRQPSVLASGPSPLPLIAWAAVTESGIVDPPIAFASARSTVKIGMETSGPGTQG